MQKGQQRRLSNLNLRNLYLLHYPRMTNPSPKFSYKTVAFYLPRKPAAFARSFCCRISSYPAFTPPPQEQVLEHARSIMQDGSDYMKKSTAILSALRAPCLFGLDASSTDISSKSKLHLPLAKVKLEKLQASSVTVPITPQPVLGDGMHPQLGQGMRSQTRKRLFDK